MYPYIYKVWLPGNVNNTTLQDILNVARNMNVGGDWCIRFTELSKNKAILSCNFLAEDILHRLKGNGRITGFKHLRQSKGYNSPLNFVYNVVVKNSRKDNLSAHLTDFCDNKAVLVGPLDELQIWSGIELAVLLNSLVKLNILEEWSLVPENILHEEELYN